MHSVGSERQLESGVCRSRLIKPREFTAVQAKRAVQNFHWSLEREAVTNERSGSFEDAPLGYSSSRGGHWPLTWVGVAGWRRSHWTNQLPRIENRPLRTE